MDTNAFVVTADGSRTLYHPGIGDHYHSRNGAVQESRHVFVGMGLAHFLQLHTPEKVSVLEVGFGTGLNFLLSADHCAQAHVQLDYVGVEAHPLPVDLIAQTEYGRYVSASLWFSFLSRYRDSWHAAQAVGQDCFLTIAHQEILQFTSDKTVDIVYFDAFAAVHQPDMWKEETLRHVCHFLRPGGVFVTYAITGNLKRALKGFGFTIEKAPGAPGKREMLRATKR